MDHRSIPWQALPHTTGLLAVFSEDFSRVARFYGPEPRLEGIRAAAEAVRLDATARARLVEILREQNRGFRADGATFENLDRLAAGAVAVVTGQQVGLFTGPAYSFYKALSAIAWARRLTEQGIDAVPVFWLATEDHDLAEISRCALLDSGGEPATVALDLSAYPEGRSVGRIFFGEEIGAAVRAALASLDALAWPALVTAIEAAYLPGAHFGAAFARLFARVLQGRGLILLDPLDADIRRMAAPVLQRAALANDEVIAALLQRNAELDRAGFRAQVKVARRATLLFEEEQLDSRRTPLRRGHHGFVGAGPERSGAALAEEIGRAPERFTPNVLLRPVVQDALLPTALYVAGPAELAYLAQAEVLYRSLLGRMPAVAPRASFTLVEANVARRLNKYALRVEDVFAGRQILRRKLEGGALPRDLARRFDAGEKSIRRALDGLGPALEQLDATLAGARRTAARKMLYQFNRLRARAGRAENFRGGVLDRHERLLLESLYPRRALQERTICLLSFLARHGPPLLDALAARGTDFSGHHILFL